MKNKKLKSKKRAPVLTHEKYDRTDMVEIKIDDMDAKTLKHLKTLMMKGAYGSINEVVRDIFRRAILGDPPPRALPKISSKEFAKRLGL